MQTPIVRERKRQYFKMLIWNFKYKTEKQLLFLLQYLNVLLPLIILLSASKKKPSGDIQVYLEDKVQHAYLKNVDTINNINIKTEI